MYECMYVYIYIYVPRLVCKMAKMRPKMAKMRLKMSKMRPKMAKMRPKMAKKRLGSMSPGLSATLSKSMRECMHACWCLLGCFFL